MPSLDSYHDEDTLSQPDAPASRIRFVRGWGRRSVLVLLGVAAAFFVRELLARGHPAFAPFLTFYPMVLLAALLDGVWAGVLVTLASAVVVEVWELAPRGEWVIRDFNDLLGVAIFIAFGISLSIVVERFHRNRERVTGLEMSAAVERERLKAEQERERAEFVAAERRRLTNVLETMPSMVSLLNSNHEVKFANSTYRQRFAVGDGLSCFAARFGRAEPCEHCETFLPLETGHAHHWEIQLPDGTHLDTYNYPFTDVDGSNVILEVSYDVTERRRNEAELRQHREHLEELVRERTSQLEIANARLEADVDQLERAQMRLAASEAKLKAALSSMTDSVIILDPQGNFVDFNDAFASLARSEKNPAALRTLSDFEARFDVILPNGQVATHKQLAFVRALNGERADNQEFTLRRKDTGQTWIRSLCFGPIRDQHGVITGAVVAGRDISAAKRAEARLRRFYETDLFAILYWKIDGTVVDANDRFLAMIGYSRADLLAGRINWVQLTPPEYQHLDEDAKRQIRETGVHMPYEKEFIRKNGSRIWGLFWAAAYEDDRTEGVSFILDITERKRTEAELAEAKQEAERSAAQLRTIFDSMEERVYVCDAQGRVIVANDIARRSYGPRYGTDAPSVYDMPRHIDCYTLDGKVMEFSEWPIARALKGERFHGVEFRVHFKQTNEMRILSSSGAPVRDKAGNIVMAVLTSADITNRKRAEEELRQKEARLGMALDAARSGAWEWDRKTDTATWSDELWGLIGLAPGIFQPNFEKWLSVVHPDDRSLMQDRFIAASEAGAEFDLSFRILRADGQVRWLATRGSPVLDNERIARSYIGIVTDITERKAAEAALLERARNTLQREQLQALAERLRKAREEERTRVSRDLHDQLGQILTAIKMDLNWIGKRAPAEEIQDRLKGSIELINEGVQSVRTICSGLRPGILDDLGLPAAIEWQANEFTARTGIACHVAVTSAEDFELGADRATAFFRIFQECLTNVSRHAEATRVDVCLFQSDGDAVMEVEDNGKGFIEAEIPSSLGILGMKERAKACSGDLQVQGSPGHGTTISVRIPLQRKIGDGTEDEHPDC